MTTRIRIIPRAVTFGALALAATTRPASAQNDITAATFGPLVTGSAVTSNGITYLGQSQAFAGITAGGTDYTFAGISAPTVILRRGTYGAPPDDTFGNYAHRNDIWGIRNSGDPATTLRPGAFTTMAATLSGNNALTGIDNLFENTGFTIGGVPAPIQTNIERADFVFAGGVKASSTNAAVFFDLGGLINHDGFKIAPILSVDSFGNPASYGTLSLISAGWGQHNLIPGGGATDNQAFTVLTDSTGVFTDVLDNRLQQVGGVSLPLNTLAATGVTVYGYSLFAQDVTDGGNANNLLDWTNATFFPQNTPDSAGGIDLVSGSGFLVTAVPEPGSIALLVGMASVGAGILRKRRK